MYVLWSLKIILLSVIFIFFVHNIIRFFIDRFTKKRTVFVGQFRDKHPNLSILSHNNTSNTDSFYFQNQNQYQQQNLTSTSSLSDLPTYTADSSDSYIHDPLTAYNTALNAQSNININMPNTKMKDELKKYLGNVMNRPTYV